MKKTVFLTALACLLFAASSVLAQSKTDFSGTWTLDVSKSKVNGIESGSMTVAQTEKDINYKTDFKRAPRPEGAAGGGQGMGGGMGRGGAGAGGGNNGMTFMLDGKETSMDMPGPQGMTVPMTMQANWDGGKLKFKTKRTFKTPDGEMTATTNDTWELVDGGKALKVSREAESPRGKMSQEFYYTKN